MSRRMFHPTILVLLAFAGLIAGGALAASSGTAPGQSSPNNTSLPSISGSAAVGQTLGASVGAWAGPTSTYSFQWQRCDASGNSCSAVGSGAASYALTSADGAASIRVMVTATNKNGSAVATSSPTAVVSSGAGAPPPTTTTGTTTTGTTTTGTTTTGTTTTTSTSTGFTTSLVQNGTVNAPYKWTFNPGVATKAGYFWADGKLLQTVTGPGPYTLTLQAGQLASGAHQFGHAWDLASDGTHQAPSSSYTETVVNPLSTTTTTTTTTPVTTTTTSASGTVEFNGFATQVNSISSTGYSSTGNLVQSQSPTGFFDCICFTNNDITLASDPTFSKIFNVSAEPGSRNPFNTGAPLNVASAQLSKGQPNDLGKWRYYAIAVKIPSASWHNPDWASLMSLGYETLAWDQLALDVDATSAGPRFDLNQNAGYANCPTTTCAGTVSGRWAIAPVVYDKWFEFVFAVKWATDTTGAVKVYMRNPGGAWTLALDRENLPTYLYGTTSYGTISADMHEEANTLDKFGLYYGYWNTATTSFPKNTIQETGIIRATDLTTAQSFLP
jgi:hypothetical protein